MSNVLRGYQQQLKFAIYEAWNKGAMCVMGVTATGSGKTVTMAHMVKELAALGKRGVIEAHRAELVGQISMALAEAGIRHNITASKVVIRAINEAHMDEFGCTFYDPRAKWTVASVDTIIKRTDPYAAETDYLFQDEGHHTLRENKWGRAVEQYRSANPNLRVLLMTATPCRGDGKGHGSHHDGIVDAMVMGPGLGDLIREGFLTSYDAYSVPVADLDLSDVHITASGEFNQQEVARAVKRSNKIVGDVVKHYQEIAYGKRAIVFAVDIEHAQTLTNAFNAAGIPAELVTGEDSVTQRRDASKRFKAGTTKVLINVDLFGEGYDIPAVEVVIMARPTASWALYSQQIGRMLRLFIDRALMLQWDGFTPDQRKAYIAASSKPRGILIDHVGNVRREYNIGNTKYSGLPEGFTAWSLDRKGRRARGVSDEIPLRKCLSCFKDYQRIYDACPHCHTAAPAPTNRSAPEFVDGVLEKLEGAVLAQMRGEVARLDAPVNMHNISHLSYIAQKHVITSKQERDRKQHALREAMAYWAGQYAEEQAVLESRFYHTFNIDVLGACKLPASDAESLTSKIRNKIGATPK